MESNSSFRQFKMFMHIHVDPLDMLPSGAAVDLSDRRRSGDGRPGVIFVVAGFQAVSGMAVHGWVNGKIVWQSKAGMGVPFKNEIQSLMLH